MSPVHVNAGCPGMAMLIALLATWSAAPTFAQPNHITELTAYQRGGWFGSATHLTITGIWPDTCVPHSPTITISDDHIHLHLSTERDPSVPCDPTPTPWRHSTTAWLIGSQCFGITTQIGDDPPVQQPLVVGYACDNTVQVACAEGQGFVAITASGASGSTCFIPRDPVISVDGDIIRLSMSTHEDDGTECGEVTVLWFGGAIAGPLPNGVYSIVLDIEDWPLVHYPPVTVACSPPSPPCPADWDGDGLINSIDISAFLTSWLGSIAAGDLLADFNNDNQVNSTDISAFITAWLDAVTTGC